MTRSQCIDLQNNFADWFDKEPLGFGYSKIWWVPLWHWLVQGFAVATICHDMQLEENHAMDDLMFQLRTELWGDAYYRWNLRYWGMRALAIRAIAEFREVNGE